MDITAISSIVSSVVGFALLNAKKDEDNTTDNGTKVPGIDPGQTSTNEQTNPADTAVTGKRGGAMYFGRELDGGVYDSFYDYSPEAGEKLYFRQDFIDNVVTNEERVKILRARMVAPFVTSELAGEDESFIGTKAKDRNGYCNGLWLYRYSQEKETVNIQNGADIKSPCARKLAKGNVRNVSFFIEIFNPCKTSVRVETMGVDDIFVGSTKCQMVHLTSNPSNIASRPTDMKSEQRSWRSILYRGYSGDKGMINKANEGLSDLQILRDDYHKIIKTGNQPYFAARELQIETLPSDATQKAVWKQCEYPYDFVEGILPLVSKAAAQDPYNIFGGLQKYGISQDVFNYEYNQYAYNPKFCEVPAGGSVLVKMVMPLADMTQSTVQYVKGSDIYRIHTSGSDAGTFDELRTDRHYYYSIFPYEQYITSDSRREFVVGMDNHVREDEEKGRREQFFRHDYNEGVRGYCVFNFIPAPELSNKNLSMKITLYGRRGDLHPKNDPIISAESNSNGRQIELTMIATPIDENDMDWRHSYYGSGPDERLSAKDQLNLYLSKTGADLGDYFDPSINN